MADEKNQSWNQDQDRNLQNDQRNESLGTQQNTGGETGQQQNQSGTNDWQSGKRSSDTGEQSERSSEAEKENI